MKGILGRKIGMTSMFSEHGVSIPVTIIKTLPNVVTNVLTTEKNGYDAIQLSAFERRAKTVSKPVLGHFKKAQTSAKYFTKEIRNMTGFKLGSTVDLSIFNVGEFVDVTSNSKGKGFAGAIKRHNQKIGPKSHGGGGGSKPTRLTGGLGDVVSNRVFKGQTMPGQMGNVRRTIQNLEIVLIDKTNNVLLVKGSIPGPKKRFVVVKQAVKGLPNKIALKLVDMTSSKLKNKLLEEAKKVGATINADMVIEQIQEAIAIAKEAKLVAQKEVAKRDATELNRDDLAKNPQGEAASNNKEQTSATLTAPKTTTDSSAQKEVAKSSVKETKKVNAPAKPQVSMVKQSNENQSSATKKEQVANDTKVAKTTKEELGSKNAPKNQLKEDK